MAEKPSFEQLAAKRLGKWEKALDATLIDWDSSVERLGSEKELRESARNYKAEATQEALDALARLPR